MSRRRAAIVAVGVLALTPQAAQAHLVVTGMGPVYDGLTHFALSPEDVLPVVALGFYAGLRGPLHARVLLAVLPAAWLFGGIAMSLWGRALPPGLPAAATAALLLGIGGILALDLKLAPPYAALTAATLGLVRGAADLSGAAWSAGTAQTLIGMAVCAFAIFALAASVTLPLKRFWMIIAARVTGSWLAAVGLLLAGWVLRYGARVQ